MTDIFDSSVSLDEVNIEAMFDVAGSVITAVKRESVERCLRPDMGNGAKIVQLSQSELQLLFIPGGIAYYTAPGTVTPLLTPSGGKILRESNSIQSHVLVENVYDGGSRSRVNVAGANATRVDLSMKGAIQVAVYHGEVFSEYSAIQAALMMSPTSVASMVVANVLGGWKKRFVPVPGSNPPKNEIHPLADGFNTSTDVVCYVLNANAAFNANSVTLTGYPLAGARVVDDEVLTDTLINVFRVADFRFMPAYNAAAQAQSQHGSKVSAFCNLQSLYLTNVSVGSLASKKYEHDGSIDPATVSVSFKQLQMQTASFTAISGSTNTMTGMELMKRIAANAAKYPLPENIQYLTEVEDFSRAMHLLSMQESSYPGVIDRFVDGLAREVDSREARVYEAGLAAGLSRNDIKAVLQKPIFLNRRDLVKAKSDRKSNAGESVSSGTAQFDKASIEKMNATMTPAAVVSPVVAPTTVPQKTVESGGLSPKDLKNALTSLKVGGDKLDSSWGAFKDELEGMEAAYLGDNQALIKQYGNQYSIGYVKLIQTVTREGHSDLVATAEAPKRGSMLTVGGVTLFIPSAMTGVEDVVSLKDSIEDLLEDGGVLVEGGEIL